MPEKRTWPRAKPGPIPMSPSERKRRAKVSNNKHRRKQKRELRKKTKKKAEAEAIRVDLDRGEWTYGSLLEYLNQNGKTHLTSYAQLQEARKLYVVQLKRPHEIAKLVDVPLDIIYHWKTIWGWDELRAKRESFLYWKVSKVLRRYKPDIDISHDRLAEKLEQLIEQTLDEKMSDGAELSDIRSLASALKSTVELRRTIKGKSNTKSEVEHKGIVAHAHGAIEDPHKMEALTGAMVDHLELPLSELLAEPDDEENITDVEFVEIAKDKPTTEES